MLSIREKEEELFSKWSEKRTDLVTDGVVSETHYEKSDPQVLYIFKEVNDKGGGGWDLREYVRERPRKQTWNMVTRWMKGIKNMNKNFDWKELKNISKQDRHEALKSISVMNLKKTPGGSTSNKKEIWKAAKENCELLNKQFSLYSPDIVICGGTGSIFRNIFELGDNINWKQTSRGISYCKFGNEKFAFDYCHPEARCPNNFKYYVLIDAIKEVMVYS